MRFGNAVLSTVILLAACRDRSSDVEPGSTVAADTATRGTVASEPPPDVILDTAASEWTAGITSAERQVSAVATVTSARIGQHADYDRVVLEFGGAEIPSYRVEYVDRPVRQCGSGSVVQVAGDAWLLVHLEPARAHDDHGRSTVEPRVLKPALPILLALHVICDYEAQVEWVLGVASPNLYRVLELAGPPRIVIDVRHQAAR